MNVPPLRRQVLVACDPATAFRLWTDDIGAWWPVASHSCFGEGSHVAFDGDRIVETSSTGETALWGTVVEVDEPSTLAFTWHPGRDAGTATRVTVSFTATADDGVTLVTLVHTGWEVLADPTAARSEYSRGWFTVLDGLTGVAPSDVAPSDAALGEPEADLWFVLQHTAGPGTPPGGVFASPDFARHVEFLRELRERGLLVAGGPLPDEAGAGMTVVRARDVAGARWLVRAAQQEDGSVTSGLLDVRVRAWRVAMTGA
jgi:uncharacterized protein YndB with AHSA1/START domain/uncharacterized protein YciI